MVKTIYHFFRLIRSANLLVIGLTMVVVQMFILKIKIINVLFDNDNISSYVLPMLDFHKDELKVFWPLLLSTLLIAGAGNIINDYFDVKADRVNKPKRLIIGKYIKRRWAMVLHWSFNSLGMLLALYVGYQRQNIWIPLIAFLSINLLWFYSAYYKRKPLIGNIMVALLVGVIPVYVLILNTPLTMWSMHHTILSPFHDKILIILFIALLAFLINLVRELVKDIQDVKGDLYLGAKTFPIKYGIRKTKYLITLFVGLTFFVMIYYVMYILSKDMLVIPLPLEMGGSEYIQNTPLLYYFLGSIVTAFLVLMMGWILLLISHKIKVYKIISTLLKVAMLFGLLTPLFL